MCFTVYNNMYYYVGSSIWACDAEFCVDVVKSQSNLFCNLKNIWSYVDTQCRKTEYTLRPLIVPFTKQLRQKNMIQTFLLFRRPRSIYVTRSSQKKLIASLSLALHKSVYVGARVLSVTPLVVIFFEL